MKSICFRSLILLFPLLLSSCKENKPEIVEEFDLCHEVVRRFLDSNDSETDLNILKNELGRYDRQYVSMKLPDDLYNCQVFYDEDPNFSNPMFYFPDYGDLTMCIPGKTYYYRAYTLKGDDEMRSPYSNYKDLIKLPSYEPTTQGVFKTKDDKVRYLNIEKLKNFRDIGGYSTADGKKVKYGMLYRGPSLDEVTVFGTTQLKDQLGIKNEIDLRYDIEKTTSSFGVNYCHYGMQAYDCINPKHSSFKKYTKVALQNIFNLLSDEANYPAVFHCAAGADRTGTLAFLISGLLGVSRDDLTKDFELTSFSDFGLRCRGKLQSPYTYGLYQNDSNNYVNWGQLVLGVVNCGDSSLSLKERFRKFVSETYEISTEKFDALERIMLE